MAKHGGSTFAHMLYMNEPRPTKNSQIDGFCVKPAAGLLAASPGLDILFFIVFLLELAFRLGERRWIWLFESWKNWADLFALGCLFAGIIGVPGLRTMVMLKLLRTMYHVTRLSKHRIPSLWRVAKELDTIAVRIFWALFVLGFTLVFISVCMMSLVKAEAFVEYDEARELFGDVPRSIFTLVQLMTLDHWGEILGPIMTLSPICGAVLVIGICFLALVSVNVIVALVVEQVCTAETLSFRRKEFHKLQRWRKAYHGLENLLGTKSYTIEEFKKRLTERRIEKRLEAIDLSHDECAHILDLITEADAITASDFTLAIRQMRREVTRIDVRDAVDAMHTISHNRKKSLANLIEVEKLLHSLRQEVKDVQKGSKLVSEAIKRVVASKTSKRAPESENQTGHSYSQ